jgi:hypothetical protein
MAAHIAVGNAKLATQNLIAGVVLFGDPVSYIASINSEQCTNT